MRLQERIRKDLTEAIKAKDGNRKDAVRVVLGEFGRGTKKELTDDEVVGILKKLIKSEKELLKQKGETKSRFITIIESYLPQMASRDDILSWIEDNIDFTQYKNKMQAMGPIMKHFGAVADGNTVKEILQKM